MTITIAIDGPASSGKGTVARSVAQALGYSYVDTGAMYRAVALTAREAGVPWDAPVALAELASGLEFSFHWSDGLLRTCIGTRDISKAIRDEAVGKGASDVAVFPAVRTALLHRQQALGARGGVVMDGRDIGTVVLPNAELKVFLDAGVEERARRRHGELVSRLGNDAPSFASVLEELRARDAQDRGRKSAPLKAAADAVYVDSTARTPEDVSALVVSLARARGG